VPNGGEQQAGEFPVDQWGAMFAQNLTKLLLSHIVSLTLTARSDGNTELPHRPPSAAPKLLS